jgi:hypothetical protein
VDDSDKPISTRIYLHPSLFQWLKDEAKRQHCSMAQVVRSLIVAEIKRRQTS